ncbi:hypothetical protein GCM10022262_10110 [Georgenia daeguensis]
MKRERRTSVSVRTSVPGAGLRSLTAAVCRPGATDLTSLVLSWPRQEAAGALGRGLDCSGWSDAPATWEGMRRQYPSTYGRSGKGMAVPKRKMSRSNTRSRRSQWKAELTELVAVRVQGREVKVPRRLAKAYQKGMLVED